MNAKRYDFFPPITGPWSVSPVHISFGRVHSNRPRARCSSSAASRLVQLEPPEQPLQGPVRRRPPGGQLQDPADLRRGPPRLLPLQRLSQRQHLLRRPRRRLPRRRHQRVEPATSYSLRHRVSVGPTPWPPAARPLVEPAGQLPGPPAPLRLAQSRLQELLHQRVPEQARLPGPLTLFPDPIPRIAR